MIELPICHWRHPHENPNKISCKSPKIINPKGVDPSLCMKCSLANHALDNKIIQLGVRVESSPKSPCSHKGKNVPPPEGRDLRKQWYVCDMGLGIVSKCMCNKIRCNLYDPDDTVEPL